MTVGKASDWIQFISIGPAFREAPGINPLNPSSNYHLTIPHDSGSGLSGLGLKGAVSDNLTTQDVRVECWFKPVFSAGSGEHDLIIEARRDTEWPNATSTPFPRVWVNYLKSSGEVTVKWGRALGGPLSPDGSVVTMLSLTDVIGIRLWVKDIDATDSQFYVQYYNGSMWVTVANYLITGIIGQSGYYAVYSLVFADYTSDDEDWLDDFVLDEDDAVPEPPPP